MPNQFNPNLSDIPDTVVIAKLREICIGYGLQYSWEYRDAGRFDADGRAYFIGELVIEERDQQGTIVDRVTRCGSAEAENDQMGISGMSTVAFKNASLRGLGMAEFLYEKDNTTFQPAPGYTPPPSANNNPPPQYNNVPPTQNVPPAQNGQWGPPPQAAAPGTYGAKPYTPRNSNGGGYNRGGNGNGNNRGGLRPWPEVRETLSPKSGKYLNVPYSQIPNEDLQKWASGATPNQLAVQELQFRAAASGLPNTPFTPTFS